MEIPKNIQAENAIIEKAKKDKQFFAPLYNAYYKSIFLFIYKKVQNEENAADLCSKTFLKALSNLHLYTFKGYPFSSWLYKIASNEVNMYYRENKKTTIYKLIETDFIEMIPLIELDEVEINYKDIIDGLNTLSLEESELIDLRFFERQSFKEIGAILNTSEASAKMKLYRVIDKLKQTLTKGK